MLAIYRGDQIKLRVKHRNSKKVRASTAVRVRVFCAYLILCKINRTFGV